MRPIGRMLGLAPSRENIYSNMPSPKKTEYVLEYYSDHGTKKYQILSTNDIKLVYNTSMVLEKIDNTDNQLNVRIYDGIIEKKRYVWWFEDEIKEIDPKLLNRIWEGLKSRNVDYGYC